MKWSEISLFRPRRSASLPPRISGIIYSASVPGTRPWIPSKQAIKISESPSSCTSKSETDKSTSDSVPCPMRPQSSSHLSTSDEVQEKKPESSAISSGRNSGSRKRCHRRANSTGTYLLSHDSGKLIRELANAASSSNDAATTIKPPQKCQHDLIVPSYSGQDEDDVFTNVGQPLEGREATENNPAPAAAISACDNAGGSQVFAPQRKLLKLLHIIRRKSKHIT